MHIDLNADLGEGAGFDEQLMPLITSANVCCGAHAGGPQEIAATFELARRFGVVVGAHPGYPDRENFGRGECHLADSEITRLVHQQIQELESLAREKELAVSFVKPHGALYNQACREKHIATAVVAAVLESPTPLTVLGLPGRLPFVPEGFADRRYRPDGSLVPRTEAGAFVHDPQEAVEQIRWLIGQKGVRTICVHGDNPDAVAFARKVREALLGAGIELKAFVGG
jgi:UPF0271 protein